MLIAGKYTKPEMTDGIASVCCLLNLLPLGECLLDQPPKPLVLPDVMPGGSYSLERQCELAFGESSKPCPFMQPPCGRLWCTGKSNGHSVCMTRHFPWADGTRCGDGQVCDRGVCSDKLVQNVKVRLTRVLDFNIYLNCGVIKEGFCCYTFCNLPPVCVFPGRRPLGQVGPVRLLLTHMWRRCPTV